MPVLPNMLRLLSILLFLSGQSDAKQDEDALLPTKPSLNMTLCTDKCTGDCQSYITPVSKCYNSGALFPNDPSWSGLDVLDTVICQTLVRTIFSKSKNASCTVSDDDSDDRFQIPLNECVGPFGAPRPWGWFSLRSSSNEDQSKDC
jgi:hypothetical protein